MSQDTRAYLGEFIGTFTLVFIGTAVATLTTTHSKDWGDTGLLAISMAFGFTLMVLVWVIGPVSGCHVNPAVSIPMALAGRMRASLLPGYLVAQFLGGFLASLVLWGLVTGLPNYEPVHGLGGNWNARNMNLASLFGVELVLSSLFIMVIFSTTRRDALRGFEAWAIGGFLFVAHLVAAQLGDASLNPARSLGPALVEAMSGKGSGALAVVWLFIVAPTFGGLIGWQLFKLIHTE
ncbi:MAG TPA: MIP/aquaporin family protein [Pirellulales bacterium]|jgi:aquaporin Z|nr:MIP/aquaporin family protein [Pirellulales bacterium]